MMDDRMSEKKDITAYISELAYIRSIWLRHSFPELWESIVKSENNESAMNLLGKK